MLKANDALRETFVDEQGFFSGDLEIKKMLSIAFLCAAGGPMGTML